MQRSAAEQLASTHNYELEAENMRDVRWVLQALGDAMSMIRDKIISHFVIELLVLEKKAHIGFYSGKTLFLGLEGDKCRLACELTHSQLHRYRKDWDQIRSVRCLQIFTLLSPEVHLRLKLVGCCLAKSAIPIPMQ